MLKRHGFLLDNAAQSLHGLLSWRMSVLPRQISRPPSFLQCLPTEACDPFGRPVIIIKLSAFPKTRDHVRPTLVAWTELLRLHIQFLNTRHESDGTPARPVLQYVVLLDLLGVSLNTLPELDLISWYVREVVPQFPGMLSAVLVLNYSWAHYGIWNLVKRVLPPTATSRVFFPSAEDLIQCFSATALPAELGGSLQPLSDLDDPLHAYIRTFSDANSTAEPVTSCAEVHARHDDMVPNSHTRIPPTSSLNPFYGYPVAYGPSRPILIYGRRRRRDLLRTLILLFWARRKSHIIALTLMILTIGLGKLSRWPPFKALLSRGRQALFTV